MGPVRYVYCVATDGHDDRLLALARSGSRTAWDQIVLDHGEALWRTVHACGLTGADALAVWQFTWLTLSQQLDDVPAVGGLRRWLVGTAALESARLRMRAWSDGSPVRVPSPRVAGSVVRLPMTSSR